MKKTRKFLSAKIVPAVAVAAALVGVNAALAETATVTTMETTGAVVTTPATTTVTTVTRDVMPPSGARIVNLNDFDKDNNGILSLDEIAEGLFKVYDTDGNHVIDNVEFEAKRVVTFAPAVKETITQYDFDNDGQVDKIERTQESVMRETRLSEFDKNNTGLSARDFAGQSFIEVDVNRDRAIDIHEWKGTYNAAIDKKNEEAARLND